MLDEGVVFLDLETTGGSLDNDRIIEIGFVEAERGRFVSEWSTLVNPCRRIPQSVQMLTGITDEMIALAPTFTELSHELAERLEGKVLAAHNARFDYGFLKSEFRRVGIRYVAPVLCTVKLSRRLFPGYRRHNLDALIMRHTLFCIDRHRALGDARVLWELAQIWQRELDPQTLSVACSELLRRPATPPGLAADIFDELPEAPGVYTFYGESDRVLYVGKGSSIRARVMAHFGGERAGKDQQIANEITRIDWTETVGEVGAQIREAQLLKALAPVYNRTRRAVEPHAWQWDAQCPELPPRLVTLDEIEVDRLGELYGVFRSRSSALEAMRTLAKRYELCPALLSIEQAESNEPCSARTLGHCRGACVGAESCLSHAMRVVQALSTLRVKPWPFKGCIALRELDPERERSELHVFDRWCYLGSVKTDADVDEVTQSAPSFDIETYKILTRCMKSLPRMCEVVTIGA